LMVMPLGPMPTVTPPGNVHVCNARGGVKGSSGPRRAEGDDRVDAASWRWAMAPRAAKRRQIARCRAWFLIKWV